MGIFGALSTAISGLQAQSTALANISNNIANSQTTAFKRTTTSFEEIVAATGANQAGSGVVRANSQSTNTVSGDILPSDVDTHIAVNGDGYFIIAEQTNTVDGDPVFGGVDLYTRVGDFEVDRNGFLVNSSGFFLKGIPVDAVTGNLSGTLPEVIQISNELLPAQATTTIEYRANLATTPKTATFDPTVANSELIGTTADYPSGNLPTVAGTGFVEAQDVDAFLAHSVAGGAITSFASNGAAVNVQVRWAKIDSVANGGTDTWNAFYQTDASATGTGTANAVWRNFGTDYTFDVSGTLVTPTTSSVVVSNLTVNGTNLGNVAVDSRSPNGSKGLSQFEDANGIVQVNIIDQNGFAAGELSSISITDAGRVTGIYTNGESVDLAEVTLAAFNADGALRKIDGGALRETPESGAAILGAQGSIVGASLESSNTDIADEFSKLIITQQAYAAGTRIVTTADEMLQEALNMVR
jgi:flagellar hook protein FlgE